MPKRVSVNCRCGRSVSVPTDELEGVFTCPHCGRRGHWRSSQGMDGGPSAPKVDAAAQTEASSPDTRREATPSTAASTPRQARETAGGAVTDEGTKLPTNPNGATCLYDAFISYRHADTDRFFAERLHRLLEAYRVPRALVRQGTPRRLTRVFRDREELDASENLSDTIKQALSSSRFLIVVCSPRTPESIWVKQEIEYFRTLEHGNRVLALLIEGEPAESFPLNLTQVRRSATNADGSLTEIVETVDPLAPDIRASRRSTSLKLLATEKLRLLAPMLGCRFDDLSRREQLRRRRQLIVWTVCLLLFGSVLGGLAWQTHAGWNLARTLDAKASKFEILAAAEETAKKKALDEQAAAENRAAAIAADAKEAQLQSAEKIKRSVDDKLSAEERAQQLARASNISENEKRRHAFSSNLDRAEQMIETDPERAASFLKDSNTFPRDLRDFAWGYRLGQADPAAIGPPIVKVANDVVEQGRDRPSIWLRHFSSRHGLVVEPTFKLIFIDPTSGTEIRSIQTGGLYAVDWERGILAKWGTRSSERNQPAAPIVLIENFETGEILGSLPANSALSGLAMSPNGRLLAGMTTTGLVGLWDLETFSPIGTFLSRGGKLQFSADGTALMTCDLEIERKSMPLKKGEKPPTPAVQVWPLLSVLTQKKQSAKSTTGSTKPRSGKSLAPLKITAYDRPLPGAAAPVYFPPDGQVLFTGSAEGLKAWSLDNKTAAPQLPPGLAASVMTASKEGNLFALASDWSLKSKLVKNSRFNNMAGAGKEPKADHRVAVYNLATGEMVQSLRQRVAPFSLALSDDARWLAAAHHGAITVHDLGRATLKLSDLHVLSVALSQNGSRLAAVVRHGKQGGVECILWDVSAGKQISAFDLKQSSSRYSPELRFLGADRRLAFLFAGPEFNMEGYYSGRIVNSEDGTEIVPMRQGFAMSEGRVPRLVWGATSLDSHFTTENVSKSLPGMLFMESLDGIDPNPLEIPTLSEPEKRERVVNTVTLSGNGVWLAIGLRERPIDSMTYQMKLIVRNLNDSSQRIFDCSSVTGFVGQVLGAAVSHNGRWVAANFYEGDQKSANIIMRIWDVESGGQTDMKINAANRPKVLGFLGPWETFLVETLDHRLEIWSAARGERIAEFAPPDIPADVRPGLVQQAVMAVSADGASLAVSSDGGRILLVDPVVGALRAELPLGSEIPNSLAFSGDGRTLAAGMSDGTVRLWFAHQDTALSSP